MLEEMDRLLAAADQIRAFKKANAQFDDQLLEENPDNETQSDKEEDGRLESEHETAMDDSQHVLEEDIIDEKSAILESEFDVDHDNEEESQESQEIEDSHKSRESQEAPQQPHDEQTDKLKAIVFEQNRLANLKILESLDSMSLQERKERSMAVLRKWRLWHSGHGTLNKEEVSCPICLKKRSAKHMKEHIQGRHFNIKEVTCSQCDSSFRYQNHLKYHIERYHNPKVHKCILCEDMFGSGKMMVEHMNTVHKGLLKSIQVPNQCRKCRKGFWEAASLRMHEKNKRCTAIPRWCKEM